MRAKRASTPAAPPAAATHEIVAHPLALLVTRGVSALVLFVTFAIMAAWGAWEVQHPAPLLVIVIVSPLAVYGVSVLVNLKHEQARFYAREVRDNRDYNGDGYIGEAGHVVKIVGRDMVLPNLDVLTMAKPAPNLRGFPVCANDVLYILERAWREGTSFRAWTGHRLPSGAKLDRNAWIAVLDGLLTWGFATARQTDTGRVVILRQDVTVDEMMRAVQDGTK